jgi:hypothetical protein
MDGYTQYNLRNATFEEFVDFLFDREVIPTPVERTADGEPWYWRAEVTFEPMRVASFYIQLFTDPGFLLDRFSLDQLEQGFWAIPSGNIECSINHIIWDKRLPFELRESCVRSMHQLYASLFAKEPLETSSNMWWDALAYDWHCGIRERANGGEDSAMQDVMFETLLRILELPQAWCQEAALHGLGHLHHPDTTAAVQRFLALTPGIDPELSAYALAAARFEVM